MSTAMNIRYKLCRFIIMFAVVCFICPIHSVEVPNFLSSDECDHLIMLARDHMGLEKSPVIKDKVEIDDETSERTFKIWDENDDGYIDPKEVGLIT